MAVFKRAYPEPTYTPYGNRRVYSTKWLNTWSNWERDNAMIGRDGAYLTNTRPYTNGRSGSRQRIYMDMSMADIDIDHMGERYLQWDIDVSTDPGDTKYMRSHRLGGVTLRDVAHMPTSDFLKLVEGLGKRTNQVKVR